MSEREMVDLIRRIIRQEVQSLIMGEIVSNETEARSTVKRFPNEADRDNTRVIAPYGFASKAPAGMKALLANVGNDPTNLNCLGHFDEDARTALNLDDGDVALYDAWGNVFKISNGKFQLGSEESSQNMVLGPALMTFLSNFLDKIVAHTHPSPGAPPTNSADFTALKNSPVADGSLLSQKSFTE